jgi:hypothetical protein
MTVNLADQLVRRFDMEDQRRFAELSGDYNPMHLDPVAARRTIAGQPVVHGMHTLLWALEVLAPRDGGDRLPSRLRADFSSFLPLLRSATMAISVAAGKRRATVTAGGVVVMNLQVGEGQSSAIATPRSAAPMGVRLPDEPLALDLGDIEGLSGTIPSATNTAISAMFPRASAWLGDGRLAALLACTRLVGMVCPGLHSIFNRVDLEVIDGNLDDRLDYTVASVDRRFRRVVLAVAGPGVSGSLFTSLRPLPASQATMSEVAAAATPAEFAGEKALAVGGSRGLGELAAKLLAAGGAEVLVTYAVGRTDAEAVCAEIVAWGGLARAIPLDVTGDVAAQLATSIEGVTTCCYFATPRIFGPSADIFQDDKFRRFYDFYVVAFDAVCAALLRGTDRPIGVYYPSTVAIDERLAGLAEYAMAKAAGEILCDEYNARQTRLRIVRSRLPRLPTDQTATVSSVSTDDPIQTILPVLRAMTGARSEI